ncbi:MAG: D-alanyl-D-alanine carboxypeptidase [Amylibacter sp.]|nr:D-alanyl-D-alanine carboxypeptidase [Amylibacter sp.]
MTAIKTVLCLIAFLATTVSGLAFETIASSAYVIDVQSGAVLYAKDAERPIPPASMSKLMTLNMLFEALKSGRITMDSKFSVSEKAHLMGGSKMFLRQGERVAVRDLIPGIIVQSGNDACVVVAEGLEGSEAAFARKMTARAKNLGMNNSTFANATGWPHPNQRMSARDLVVLATRLQNEFPEYYSYFAQDTFTWANISQNNRNPLLKMGIGADGLKTGHTQEAGYGLVGSAVQDGRRVTFMITGMQSSADRASEGERVINWAFRNFTEKTVYEKDVVVGTADVWLGKESTVELYSPTAIKALMPYDAVDNYKATIRYTGPIEAPIAKDAQIATLVIQANDMAATKYPLYAKSNVPKTGLLGRMKVSASKIKEELMGPSEDR